VFYIKSTCFNTSTTYVIYITLHNSCVLLLDSLLRGAFVCGSTSAQARLRAKLKHISQRSAIIKTNQDSFSTGEGSRKKCMRVSCLSFYSDSSRLSPIL